MNIQEAIKKEKIIKISDLPDFNITKPGFYKIAKKNNYQKIAPGVYASKNEIVDDLFILHNRCHLGVFSHDEALYYHHLIDREPLKHTITVYSGYNGTKLKGLGCKVFYVDKDYLYLGKEYVTDNFGNRIPIYDMERTIVDLIRNRSSFEIQDFNTALKAYVHRSDKNLNRLMMYAEKFHVSKIIEKYMEVLL